MNPNDILQQQQAMIDQMMHRAEQMSIVMMFVSLIGTAISAWILYMFYRCLRDTADELAKIRIICEFMSARQVSSIKKAESFGAPKENPFASDQDKYKPKE
jgi:type II secretory pathway component PulC